MLQSADEAMNVLPMPRTFASPRRVLAASGRHHGAVRTAYLRREARRLRQRSEIPASRRASTCCWTGIPRTREERVATVITTTLTKMARGGVYDQLAGGFHRYSVDEHWIVPHFEKMSYDNSELLKNYVHAYQVFGYDFYAHVARDIIRWMDEWLSDRERGGFYASQDADINLDDDGDYFTWTVDEAKAALNEKEFQAVALHYDIESLGEMQHDPSKNVLWVRALPEEVASRLGIDQSKTRSTCSPRPRRSCMQHACSVRRRSSTRRFT